MNLPRPPKKCKKPIPKNTIKISKRKIQKDNKLFNHVLSVVDKKIQDRILSFSIEIFKKYTTEEIRRMIEVYESIETFVKIANNIYKIVYKVNEFTKEAEPEFVLQKDDEDTLKKYKQDYHKHKKIYDKYNLQEVETPPKICFGEIQEIADNNFHFVKRGEKTAISLLYKKEKSKAKLKRLILTNWDESQQALLEVKSSTIKPFKKVTEQLALKEDMSLEDWKSTYQELFSSILEKDKKTFSENTKILQIEFRVEKIIDAEVRI